MWNRDTFSHTAWVYCTSYCKNEFAVAVAEKKRSSYSTENIRSYKACICVSLFLLITNNTHTVSHSVGTVNCGPLGRPFIFRLLFLNSYASQWPQRNVSGGGWLAETFKKAAVVVCMCASIMRNAESLLQAGWSSSFFVYWIFSVLV